jgi:nucleoside-diphosphate-sugar epimerase
MNTSPPPTRVLVTGANGFIGLHTTLRLLQLDYRVRATVRSETAERNVRDALAKHTDISKLEFACTDLLKDDGWQEAVRGCDSVIHTASPYPSENPKDENTVILPARDGTLRVLRAAEAEGIKRVVMVSSIVAVLGGHSGEDRTFAETDWTNLEKCPFTYHKSKTLAERAAWDFIRSAENKSGMEMVAINPSNVFGPVLDNHHHTSIEWFRTQMHHEVPGVSRTQLNIVDVRDIVEVFVKSMTGPEAAGKRFICNGASIPLLEFADILQQNFSKRGYRIPNRILPDLMIRFMALLIPKVRAVADELHWTYALSTEQARSIFGWQPRPYRQTILEMAESLIEYGLV